MQRGPPLGPVVAAAHGLAVDGDRVERGLEASTQSMKQAANRAGSIRFIIRLSQRPEGTPHL